MDDGLFLKGELPDKTAADARKARRKALRDGADGLSDTPDGSSVSPLALSAGDANAPPMPQMFHAAQKQAFDIFWSDPDITNLLVIGPRRFGKTHLAGLLSVLLCMGALGMLPDDALSDKIRALYKRNERVARDFTVLMAVPYKKQGEKEVMKAINAAIRYLRELKVVLPRIDPKIARGQIELTSHDGNKKAYIGYMSLRREADAERGGGADVLIADEIADIVLDVLQTIGFPMLLETNGLFFGIGTAKLTSNMITVQKFFANKVNGGKVLNYSCDDLVKAGYWTPKQRDDTISRMGGPDSYRVQTELYGRLDLPVESAILTGWQPQNYALPQRPIWLCGVDIGFRDPYALLLLAVDRAKKRVLITYGREWRFKYLDDTIIPDFKKDLQAMGLSQIDYMALPWDARTRKAAARRGETHLWHESGLIKNMPMVVKRIGNVPASVRAVQANMSRLHIAAEHEGRGEAAVARLKAWRYSAANDETPEHDDACHTGDALRAAIGLLPTILRGHVGADGRPAERPMSDPISDIIDELRGVKKKSRHHEVRW